MTLSGERKQSWLAPRGVHRDAARLGNRRRGR
jgi:hypothetical protein